jgi:hypothetical protein
MRALRIAAAVALYLAACAGQAMAEGNADQGARLSSFNARRATASKPARI